MSAAHLRNIDLNLLLPLQVLLQEKNVTRAARRLHLTQSAVSRALGRLREELGDDLLVRAGGLYELTPRAKDLLQELDLLLPRLEQMWAGQDFSVQSATGHIRVAMTDYAAAVLLPHVLPHCERLAPNISVEVTPWQEHSYEELRAARLDLVLSPLAVPSAFRMQPLFADRFACFSRGDMEGAARPFTLLGYLKRRHVSVETEPHQQNLIDRTLAELGQRRVITLRLPFLLAAFQVLAQTDLLLTTPLRLAFPIAAGGDLAIAEAPPELPVIRYASVWHPRLDQEPLQGWFRALVLQVCQRQLATELI